MDLLHSEPKGLERHAPRYYYQVRSILEKTDRKIVDIPFAEMVALETGLSKDIVLTIFGCFGDFVISNLTTNQVIEGQEAFNCYSRLILSSITSTDSPWTIGWRIRN
ncbi:MAG: hypothetical protein V3T17_11290 [Pseudomonadales bacterium]